MAVIWTALSNRGSDVSADLIDMMADHDSYCTLD
jgi:hypothetical protein